MVFLPVASDIGADLGKIKLAAQHHDGRQRGGLAVVGAHDARDVDAAGIPVVLIFDIDLPLLRDIFGQPVGPAVIEIGVGQAEALPLFGQQLTTGRHEADVGQRRQKVGHRLLQRVFQRIIVGRPNADSRKITDIPLVKGARVLQHIQRVVALAAVLGAERILRGGHKVVRRHIADVHSLAGVPADAAPQRKGPAQAVARPRPAGGQRGAQAAVGVVFDQRVDAVGADGLIGLIGRNKIVERRKLGGIQLPQLAARLSRAAAQRQKQQERQQQSRRSFENRQDFHRPFGLFESLCKKTAGYERAGRRRPALCRWHAAALLHILPRHLLGGQHEAV